MDGFVDRDVVGTILGSALGRVDGVLEGSPDGARLGGRASEGSSVGTILGGALGRNDGASEGSSDGSRLDPDEGIAAGLALGFRKGSSLACLLGKSLGPVLAILLGPRLGQRDSDVDVVLEVSKEGLADTFDEGHSDGLKKGRRLSDGDTLCRSLAIGWNEMDGPSDGRRVRVALGGALGRVDWASEAPSDGI